MSVAAVVLADSEDVQAHLIRALDLLDQVAQALRRILRLTGVIVSRGKTVNPDLHPVR